MREILFRGKCKDTGKWFIGDLTTSQRYPYKDEYIIISVWQGPGHFRHDVFALPETVGQLLHCDKLSGQTFFEGDILKREYHFEANEQFNYEDKDVQGYRIGTAAWDKRHGVCLKGGFWYNKLSKTSEMLPKSMKSIVFSRTEIIGNIHENPELLTPPILKL